MSAVTERQILDALGRIADPDKGADIVSLGMVSGLVIRDGNVAFAIEVESERGPRLEPLRKAAEKAVEALPGVLSVTAVLTAQAPPRGRTRRAAARRPPPDRPASARHAGPCPGSVRSSRWRPARAASANRRSPPIWRWDCKANGLRVGVLDADIYGPSMPRMLGISGRPRSRDGKTLIPMENYGLKCMSMGFLVPEDTPMIWRGPMVMSALQQMLREVEWGELDIMIADMPPGTGDAQLTMAQQVPLAGAVIVSTPQDIALLDARKGLNMFTQGRGAGARHRREYELFPVPALRRPQRDLLAWRRPPGGRAPRHRVSRRGAARPEDPRNLRRRHPDHRRRPRQPATPLVFRQMAARIWEKVAGESADRRPPPRIVIE